MSATERSIFFIENDGSPHTMRGAESTGPIMDGHSAPAQNIHGAGIHPQALPKGATRVCMASGSLDLGYRPAVAE